MIPVQVLSWHCRRKGPLKWGVSHALIKGGCFACGAQTRLRPTTINPKGTRRPQTPPCEMCERRTKEE